MGVILCATPNAALDITYSVGRLVAGQTHRVTAVSSRAGGKGINVARTLDGLGISGLTMGFVGGEAGRAIRADLEAAGLPHELVQIDGPSRRTVTIVAEETTGFYEPGAPITHDEWQTFLDRYQSLLGGADAVALCGSLPPGAPPDAYATLSTLAHGAGVPVALDADGEALSLALVGRPDVVKVNADEVARATAEIEPRVGAEQLRAGGAGAVVITHGADGISVFCPEGQFHARPPEHVAGNPTGAGDAAMAALTLGLARGQAWPVQLADAAALSAAAVRSSVAGDFDREAFARWRHLVEVARIA